MTPRIGPVEWQASVSRLLATIGPRWREFTEHPEHFELRTAEFVLLLSRLYGVNDFTARRVLEIGCGNGYSLRLWAEIADEVVGIDLPTEIAQARRLLAVLPATNVKLVEGVGEDLSAVSGHFDLIVTQYVLEHVRDIDRALGEVRLHLAPGGWAVHIVPNLADRHEWYLRYRWETSMPRRVGWSLRSRGLWRTLRDPLLAFTPAHSPEFGDFAREHQQYRLERWALRLLKAGFVLADHFQTRDVNWVIVSRSGRNTS